MLNFNELPAGEMKSDAFVYTDESGKIVPENDPSIRWQAVGPGGDVPAEIHAQLEEMREALGSVGEALQGVAAVMAAAFAHLDHQEPAEQPVEPPADEKPKRAARPRKKAGE